MAFLGDRRRSALKALILVAGGVFAALAIFILTLGAAFYTLNSTDMVDFKSCYTASWRGVQVCPGRDHYVSLHEAPDHLKWSVLLAEDASFYQHSGFDWFEIQKSIDANIEKGAYVRGASTITQQLAKNLYLSGEKTIYRKLKEALLTRKIEQTYSKDQILEAYMNIVELGDDVYGFGRAARHYFGLDVRDLSPSHSAFLASLLPSPTRYESHLFQNQAVHPRQMERIRRIFQLLLRHQRIDQSYAQALESRESMNFWTSFQIFPSDTVFQVFPQEGPPTPQDDLLPEAQIPESEFSDAQSPQVQTPEIQPEMILLNEEAPTDSLDSPVGEEGSEDHEHTEID